MQITDNQMTPIYLQLLEELVLRPTYKSSPRGLSIREILNPQFTLSGLSNYLIDFTQTGTPERDPVYRNYLAKEHAWYLSCNTRADSAPSKFWLKLADKQGLITSNYGDITLRQEQYFRNEEDGSALVGLGAVVKILNNDPDSRQALIHYNQPKHYYEGNKDIPCCVINQFFIREDRLLMSVMFRSNDISKGLPYDIVWCCSLQQMVLEKLQISKPDLVAGPVTYNIGSLHLYESDLPMALKILGLRPFTILK